MSSNIEGKLAIITGASRGIPLTIAKKLAADGISVILVARDKKKLETEVNLINTSGGKALFLDLDFMESNATQVLEQFLKENRYEPNIIVHGIGGAFGSKTYDESEVYEKIIKLNFLIAHDLTMLVHRFAAKQGWGRFIFLGTLAINQKSAPAPYVAAKSALLSYMKIIAKEFAAENENLLAMAVSPGAINVPGKFLHSLALNNELAFEMFMKENRIGIGRLGEPIEIANVISFVCRNESNYLHGCNIEIDGSASN